MGSLDRLTGASLGNAVFFATSPEKTVFKKKIH
jgi:hypothetical protein